MQALEKMTKSRNFVSLKVDNSAAYLNRYSDVLPCKFLDNET